MFTQILNQYSNHEIAITNVKAYNRAALQGWITVKVMFINEFGKS